MPRSDDCNFCDRYLMGASRFLEQLTAIRFMLMSCACQDDDPWLNIATLCNRDPVLLLPCTQRYQDIVATCCGLP